MEELARDLPRYVPLVFDPEGVLVELPAGQAVPQALAGAGAFRIGAAVGPAPGAGVIVLNQTLSLRIGHQGHSPDGLMEPIRDISFHGLHLDPDRCQGWSTRLPRIGPSYMWCRPGSDDCLVPHSRSAPSPAG